MNIKLYIGAHKTATTHIQGLLSSSRNTLLENDISLSTPSDIRPLWSHFLNPNIKSKNAASAADLVRNSPANGVWIFADEYFCGVLYDFKTKQGIYPNLHGTLVAFKNLFPNAEIEVFFSIRSYDTYYASCYLEAIRNNGFFSFAEFYDDTRYSSNSWHEVVVAILDVLGEQNQLKLWCYEDFFSVLPIVIKKMTGLENTSIGGIISAYKTDKTRPSISQKALNILETQQPFDTKEEAKQLLEELNDKYPASPDNGYFAPFEQRKVDQLRTQYRADIELIRYDYPNIDFLNTNQ